MTMEETPIGKIREHFGKVKDPRIGNATRHKLLDMIEIAICAVVCGADGWSDIALFGKSKQDLFKKFLELPHGIPSHDTFGGGVWADQPGRISVQLFSLGTDTP
jgi:hypothetical protein